MIEFHNAQILMDRDKEEIKTHLLVRLLNFTYRKACMCFRRLESRERAKVHILATSYTITATDESLI